MREGGNKLAAAKLGCRMKEEEEKEREGEREAAARALERRRKGGEMRCFYSFTVSRVSFSL